MAGSKKILITGAPGVGKTTLIVRLKEKLKGENPAGFYTEEIREKGIRRGFALVGLDNSRSTFSHVNIRGPFRVGKYGVDITGFEKFLKGIDFFDRDRRLVIIDEIGKMECLSAEFRKLVQVLLDSDKIIIATIAGQGTPFIESLKKRQDIILHEITPSHRNRLAEEILAEIAPGK